jgi:hypothetical protein
VPNYDLGTAHGKIVVDYKDTGTGRAAADLKSLRARAKEFSAQFSDTAKKYATDARNMAAQGQSLFSRLSSGIKNFSTNANEAVDNVTRFAKVFGALSGAIALTIPLISNAGSATLGLRGGIQIIKSMRLALGDVPKGAEGFPTFIKKIIQVSAAVSLFHKSTSLIQEATGRFRLLGTVGGLVGKFGSSVNNLAGPLRVVAGIAGAAATALLSFRIVKQLIKPALAFTGAVGGLGGALHIVSGLYTSIVNLTGLIGLIPAAAGAAALAIGTLMVGFSGFDKVLKAIGKGDLAAFNEAIKDMAPNAQGAARSLRDVYEKGFKPLRLDVQQRLFAGVGDIIGRLGALYMPLLQRSMGKVADSFNRAFKDVAAFFDKFEGSREVADDVGQGLDFTAKIVDNLTKTFAPLVRAFYMIWRVGVEVLADLTSGAGAAAERFATFIEKARATGDLKRWIQEGVDEFKHLWNIIKNVGLSLSAIWNGLNLGGGQSFLATLDQMTASMNQFLRSAEGKRILALLADTMDRMWQSAQKLGNAFVQYVLPALEEILPPMAELAGGVIDGIVIGLKILSPLFIAVGKAMKIMAPVLRPILTALVALGVVAVGSAVAFGILGKAFTILRFGWTVLSGLLKGGSFIFRALTGGLNPVEAKLLSLTGTILKKVIPAFGRLLLSSKGLKLGAVGALLAIGDAAKNAIEERGNAALQKAPEDRTKGENVAILGAQGKWGQWFIEGWKGVFQDSKAEITGFFSWLGGIMSGLGGQVLGWLAGVGNSFKTSLVDPILQAGQSIGTFFTTTLPGFFSNVGGFFSGLPAQITGYLSGLGTSLSTAASNAWEAFKQATIGKFNEIAGTTGTLPYRIGFFIGALIGMAATWAVQTWEAFKQGTITKFNEIVAVISTWPGRIAATFVGLATTLYTSAQNAFNSWNTAAEAKFNEFIAWASGVPGRIIASISALGSQLAASASAHWSAFKSAAQAKINEVVADARAFPGRVAAAISSLAGQLASRASAAWSQLKASFSAGISAAVSLAASLPGRVASVLGNLGNALYNAGRNLIQGFVNGIRSMVGAVAQAAAGVVAGARAYFPFSPAKKGPLSGRGYTSYSGQKMIADFAAGMLSNQGLIANAAAAAANAARISGNFNLGGKASGLATAGGALPAWTGPTSTTPVAGATTNTFHVTIPAKDIAEMKNVADFFATATQRARAGRATR